MQRLDSFCASVLWFEFHGPKAEGNWRGALLRDLSNYSFFAEANSIAPQVGCIPCWVGETRKHRLRVLAKGVKKTKWKISFPQESAVVVRGCCYFVLLVVVWWTWLWWISEDFDISMLLCQMIKSDSFSSECSGHSFCWFVGVHVSQPARQLCFAVLHNSYLVLSSSTEVLFFEDSKWGELVFLSSSLCHWAVLCHQCTGGEWTMFQTPNVIVCTWFKTNSNPKGE